MVQLDSVAVVSKHVTARVDYPAPLSIGPWTANEMTIKASSAIGKYKAYYRVTAKGIPGITEDFEILVE